MRRWLKHQQLACLHSRARNPRRRLFHSDPGLDVNTVEVACASSGSITVDLYNGCRHSLSTPMVIYIPPFSSAPGTRPAIPQFLRPYPTAVINYRWTAPAPMNSRDEKGDEEEADFSTPLHWPTPIHDVLAGYTWITENLRPGRNARRDLYLYSSHAGASLAASLALTESHHHEPIAVRGLVTWNGIYNWSMFLPDHRVNKPASARSRKLPPRPEEGSALRMLETKMPDLFRAPVDLFDPFVSPSLFFQTAGMLTPSTFTQSVAMSSLLDSLSSLKSGMKLSDLLGATALPSPRRSALLFPPRKSTLKLPATLLLHDTLLAPPTKQRRAKSARGASALPTASRTARKRKRVAGHTFEAQALELAGLMRRSLEKLEFKARVEWDEGFDVIGEAERRVRVMDVGENEGIELGERGQAAVSEWLEERICL